VAQIHRNWVPNAQRVLPGTLENGGSKPRVCRFDDRVKRVVKWHPSRHGLTATYSELVASRLGQLVGAPTLRGSIVYVDHVLLPPDIGSWVTQPFHVGFTYMPGSNFRQKDFEFLDNRGALPSAAVLLAWLQMGDHDGRNEYLRRVEEETRDGETIRKKEYFLIDQSAILGIDDWSNAGFGKSDQGYELPKGLRKQIYFDEVERVLEGLGEVEEGEITSCLEHYPDEWGIDPRAVERLSGFLLDRRRYLGSILEANLKMRLGG
jgi:hypothetical protein